MTLITVIKLLALTYDEGCVWYSIDEILFFLLELVFFIMISPFIILGDIIFMPITIFIFLARKYSEKKINRKYTLKDFIDEII